LLTFSFQFLKLCILSHYHDTLTQTKNDNKTPKTISGNPNQIEYYL
jgi:hypothetical protein